MRRCNTSTGSQCESRTIFAYFRASLPRHSCAISPSCTSHTHRHSALRWTTHLLLMVQHAPNLQSLQCTLVIVTHDPITLPAKLTSLDLILDENADEAINGMLTTLAAHPSLSCLRLGLSVFNNEDVIEDGDDDDDEDDEEEDDDDDDEEEEEEEEPFDETAEYYYTEGSDIDLRLLAASRSLTDLTLVSSNMRRPKFTRAHVSQIRSSLGHLRRFSIQPDDLARFLRLPVTVRWQDIGFVHADEFLPDFDFLNVHEDTGDVLLRLPTLTTLDIAHWSWSNLDFLPQLPLLTSIRLCRRDLVPTEDVLASLLLCNGLTDLGVECVFDTAQWSALFANLTIKKLTVRRDGAMTSLECFAAGPITQSLEELTLRNLKLPLSELPHLYTLRCLRSLDIDRCFSSELDDEILASLTPPTPLFPALTKLLPSLAARREWQRELIRQLQQCDARRRSFH